MPLKLPPGSLDILSQGFSFEFTEGDARIACFIRREVLQDLGDYHGVNFASKSALDVLVPEIQRLVRAKLRPERLEENGGLVIRPSDLLRYGFGGLPSSRSANPRPSAVAPNTRAL